MAHKFALKRRVSMPALTILIALLVLGAACTATPHATEPDWDAGAPSALTEGRWFAGDFHLHTSVGSNDTRLEDGRLTSWPETVRDVALERGMDFVVITDHSNSAGSVTTTTREFGDRWNEGPEFPLWDTAAALSSATFLMIDGSEISPVSSLPADDCENCSSIGTGELEPVGHVGCFPNDLNTFDLLTPIIDRPPGAVTGGEGVDQCHDLGGLAVINHPFPNISPWIEYDWTSRDYDGIEVWNGGVGFDESDLAAFDAYLCDRLDGKAVFAVGGSDNHRTLLPYEGSINLNPPLGLPMTSVFAADLSWPSLTAAIRNARVVVHDSSTFVDFRIYAGRDYKATIGDSVSLAGAEQLTVLLRGKSAMAQNLQWWYSPAGGCEDKRTAFTDLRPAVVKTAIRQTEVQGAFERKFDFPAKPGVYFATVGDFDKPTLNRRNVAVTNVVTIR